MLIHTINYRISCSYLHYTVLHLQFAKIRALQSLVLICSSDSECYSNLFHFQKNIYNGLMFENATYFAFLLCYLKILFNADPSDRQMLWKNIYRVDRAANHHSNSDMENYENRPLNKPITAIMSQHTWKCTAKSDSLTELNPELRCRKDKGYWMWSRILLHSCHFILDVALKLKLPRDPLKVVAGSLRTSLKYSLMGGWALIYYRPIKLLLQSKYSEGQRTCDRTIVI